MSKLNFGHMFLVKTSLHVLAVLALKITWLRSFLPICPVQGKDTQWHVIMIHVSWTWFCSFLDAFYVSCIFFVCRPLTNIPPHNKILNIKNKEQGIPKIFKSGVGCWQFIVSRQFGFSTLQWFLQPWMLQFIATFGDTLWHNINWLIKF